MRLILMSLLVISQAAPLPKAEATLPPNAAAPADPAYVATIEQWRRDFDQDVRTGGWLTLVDRVKLEEGARRVGSAADCDIRLPPAAPAHVGELVRRGEGFHFTPASQDVLLDEARIHRDTEVSTAPGNGRIRFGHIELHVRRVGDDFYLFVIDEDSPAVARFRGNDWYPVNPAFRIPARFEAYPRPEAVRVSLTHVESKQLMTATGDVVFEFAGHPVRLRAFIDENELFVMFQDATNGRETYGGGRFLYAPLPKDGGTVLDFNKAFNPYCSLNPNVLCPIPPAQNRLEVGVAAGEKFHGEH
jgi:uncharacterized protein (DUF1684 family)